MKVDTFMEILAQLTKPCPHCGEVHNVEVVGFDGTTLRVHVPECTSAATDRDSRIVEVG